MGKSRIIIKFEEEADLLEQIVASLKGASIASHATLDPPASATLNTSSQIIVPAKSGGLRLVAITNLGIQDGFFTAHPGGAVAGAGNAILQNQRSVLPLQSGEDMHGVTQMATTALSFQVYG